MSAELAIAGFAIQAVSFIGSLFGASSAARRQQRNGWALSADALGRGEESVFQLRTDVSRLMGRQRSTLAGRGIDITQGSAKALREETKALSERDVTRLRFNAQREARFLRMNANAQASQFQSQALGQALGALPTLITSGNDAWRALGWGDRPQAREPARPSQRSNVRVQAPSGFGVRSMPTGGR